MEKLINSWVWLSCGRNKVQLLSVNQTGTICLMLVNLAMGLPPSFNLASNI
jgi:hypothetical protein